MSVVLRRNYVFLGAEFGICHRLVSLQVVLQHCKIGKRCTIMDGAKIGGKAFVLVQQPDGSFRKQPQTKVVQAHIISVSTGSTLR